MSGKYICSGFRNDEEFISYHRQRARNGIEDSKRIIETRTRLELEELRRQAKKRQSSDEYSSE